MRLTRPQLPAPFAGRGGPVTTSTNAPAEGMCERTVWLGLQLGGKEMTWGTPQPLNLCGLEQPGSSSPSGL